MKLTRPRTRTVLGVKLIAHGVDYQTDDGWSIRKWEGSYSSFTPWEMFSPSGERTEQVSLKTCARAILRYRGSQ